MYVVSDRHESIIKAVSKVYPNVPHFACIWHLWKNVYNKYRKSHKVLSGVYYAMAKAYTQDEFDMLMEKVETVDIRVKDYLELAGREKWSRLYAPVNRSWTMTSNIAESINSALVQARELPIFDFLEEVRIMFGRWNFTNRQNGSYTFTTLGKKFNEMLTINERKSARMTVIPSTEYVHTVIDEGRRFIVCIQKKTCSCKEFQMEEIPCPHAWAVLKKKNLTADNYCSKIYKPETVMKTYDIPVYPLPDESEWKIPGYILEEATPRLSEDKMKQCVDPKLNNDCPAKAIANILCIISSEMAAVAALCVQYEADFWPNMTIVVKALQPLLNAKPAGPESNT
ncbi:uncharacterized protein LOC132630234 [Lycium barbarum]|uniref:uncharacterized protein LOC132630234 n=1 Tax=Lycium barbarum TaxID=112863 RepID=UPI00293F17E9|nr:uncharacterized protein LOC132630234 [Lycium barbarum]